MAAKLKKRALAEYQSQVLTEDAAANSGILVIPGITDFPFLEFVAFLCFINV